MGISASRSSKTNTRGCHTCTDATFLSKMKFEITTITILKYVDKMYHSFTTVTILYIFTQTQKTDVERSHYWATSSLKSNQLGQKLSLRR